MLLIALQTFVPAAWAEAYVPDTAEFDGATTLAFPPHDSLTISDGGTIEFWVAPGWTAPLDYDPVVVANTGPQGPLYKIAILQSRRGLAVVSGTQIGLAPFDFAQDDAMHHVAVTDLGDTSMIMIDGRFVGEVAVTFSDLPSSGFWIGSADGQSEPFSGAIAGLRLWDSPVTPEDLVEFATRSVFDAADPHPDLPFLVGHSDFRDGSFYLPGYQADGPAAPRKTEPLTNGLADQSK